MSTLQVPVQPEEADQDPPIQAQAKEFAQSKVQCKTHTIMLVLAAIATASLSALITRAIINDGRGVESHSAPPHRTAAMTPEQLVRSPGSELAGMLTLKVTDVDRITHVLVYAGYEFIPVSGDLWIDTTSNKILKLYGNGNPWTLVYRPTGEVLANGPGATTTRRAHSGIPGSIIVTYADTTSGAVVQSCECVQGQELQMVDGSVRCRDSPTAAVPIPPLDMGFAGRYAVLVGTASTIAGATHIRGSFGQYPGSAVTTSGSAVFHDAYEVDTALAQRAQRDLLLAREDANSRNVSRGSRYPRIPATGALAGMILIPGVYETAGAINLAGALTFNAEHDPSAVWIIRSPGAFTTAAGSSMSMINGGCPGNIFFVVGGAATFGAGSTLLGTNLIQSAVTGGAGSTFGPVLTASEAVTLSANDICTYCTPGMESVASVACCSIEGCPFNLRRQPLPDQLVCSDVNPGHMWNAEHQRLDTMGPSYVIEANSTTSQSVVYANAVWLQIELSRQQDIPVVASSLSVEIQYTNEHGEARTQSMRWSGGHPCAHYDTIDDISGHTLRQWTEDCTSIGANPVTPSRVWFHPTMHTTSIPARSVNVTVTIDAAHDVRVVSRRWGLCPQPVHPCGQQQCADTSRCVFSHRFNETGAFICVPILVGTVYCAQEGSNDHSLSLERVETPAGMILYEGTTVATTVFTRVLDFEDVATIKVRLKPSNMEWSERPRWGSYDHNHIRSISIRFEYTIDMADGERLSRFQHTLWSTVQTPEELTRHASYCTQHVYGGHSNTNASIYEERRLLACANPQDLFVHPNPIDFIPSLVTFNAPDAYINPVGSVAASIEITIDADIPITVSINAVAPCV